MNASCVAPVVNASCASTGTVTARLAAHDTLTDGARGRLARRAVRLIFRGGTFHLLPLLSMVVTMIAFATPCALWWRERFTPCWKWYLWHTRLELKSSRCGEVTDDLEVRRARRRARPAHQTNLVRARRRARRSPASSGHSGAGCMRTLADWTKLPAPFGNTSTVWAALSGS